MILADNGSGIFLSGAPDNRWNNNDLSALKTITAANFEVVSQGTVYTPSNVPAGTERDVHAGGDDDVHAVLDQRVRAGDGVGDGDGPLGGDGYWRAGVSK